MGFDKITVVINTFHSEDRINKCLDSVPKNLEKIIIENSSNTKFKIEIEKKYSNVTCFLAGKNLGYAKGNNLGLSKVKTQFALILNPDAKIEKDTINNFLISANLVKNFSIIGPAIQDEFNSSEENLPKQDLFQVDYLKGFAMFLNLDEFKEIGFFDENFFIYLEETDLCRRLKKEKKKIYLDKKIKISHLGGSSHNKVIDYEMELSRNWHWMWSKFYFNKKHYGFFYSLLSVSGNFISSLFKIIFYTFIFNKKKRRIYFQRFSGLTNSIIGKKSWYRPKI
tara:strand:- start:2078 stop:2920 length:843 start_codon:yes stop_codon:yes gene_type:complete